MVRLFDIRIEFFLPILSASIPPIMPPKVHPKKAVLTIFYKYKSLSHG